MEKINMNENAPFNKKTEMSWGIGITLIIFGILGVDHSPVFGMFATSLLQDIFYILIGLLSLGMLVTHKPLSKYFAILFGVLGILGLLFPIGSFADSYLHFFISLSYLWIYAGKDEKESQITIRPA